MTQAKMIIPRLELVAIEQCRFLMGSTSEEVDHCVREWSSRLASPTYDVASFRQWIMKEFPAFEIAIPSYRIARYPTTNRDYGQFVQATGSREPESFAGAATRGEHPVWGVTYPEAEAYAAWLSAETNIPLRLPTEPEWEFAARGPSRRVYPWGDVFAVNACNTLEAGINDTTEVTRYDAFASPFGICDLAGNVEEWTSSFYTPYPGGEWVDDDLSRLHGGHYRVMRGGSFARNGDLARGARRHGPFREEPFKYKGFRLAADARPDGDPL